MRRNWTIILFACQSFAWFTSKDEVSNRLSANADYGVSIVESFAPPKNWLPGTNTNKDVYDVNTGSIDAFVKNDVTGKLSYTYETLMSEFDETNGVQLNKLADTEIDGATTMEAGSFLAWTSTNERLGNKASVRVEDADVFGNRWVPTENGIYIFRRSDNNGTAENGFTYSGYYFKDGKYYKIVLGDDPYPTYDSNGLGEAFDVSATQSNLGAGASVDKDTGIISGTPTIRYAVESKVDNVDVNFRYDNSVAGKPKLVVEYAANTSIDSGTPTTPSNTYDASATAARAEVDYLNAKEVSDRKTERFDQIEADYDYAKKLQEARDALVAAAKTRGALNDAYTSATTANNDAQDDVNTEGTNLYNTYFKDKIGDTSNSDDDHILNTIAVDTIVDPTDVQTHIDAINTPKCYANLTAMQALEDEINGLVADINDQLETLKDADVTAADAATAVSTLRQKAAQLKLKLQQYKEKFANLEENTDAEHVTGLDTANTTKQAIQDVIDDVDDLLTQIDAANGIADLSVAYTEAAADYATNVTNATTPTAADADWTQAKTDYGNAVTQAKSEYEAAIAAIKHTDYTGTITNVGQNNSDKIVPYNSARRVGTAPALDTGLDFAGDPYKGLDYNYYRTLVPGATVDIPGSSNHPAIYGEDYLDKSTFQELGYADDADWNLGVNGIKTYSQLETAKTAAQADTDAKKKVFDEAKRVLPNGGKVIKINVYLDPAVETNWTRDTSTDGTSVASFYLNNILEAGETSAKLIDSVELDSSVETGTYKNMTFDLNVALDSAQVTYDANDQTRITADSVTTPAPFGMKVTGIDQGTKNVTWSAL